jgi:hypothetical protein
LLAESQPNHHKPYLDSGSVRLSSPKSSPE